MPSSWLGVHANTCQFESCRNESQSLYSTVKGWRPWLQYNNNVLLWTPTVCFLGRSGDAEYDSTIITSHSIMDEASSSGDERKNIGITFLGSALHWKWMWPRQLIHLYNMGGPVPTKWDRFPDGTERHPWGWHGKPAHTQYDFYQWLCGVRGC